MSNKLKKKTENKNISYNKKYTEKNNGFLGKLEKILTKEKSNIDLKSKSRKNVIDSITMICVELILLFLVINRSDILHEFGMPENSTTVLLSMSLIFFSIKDIIKSVIRIKNKEAIIANKIIIGINLIFTIVGIVYTIIMFATNQATL